MVRLAASTLPPVLLLAQLYHVAPSPVGNALPLFEERVDNVQLLYVKMHWVAADYCTKGDKEACQFDIELSRCPGDDDALAPAPAWRAHCAAASFKVDLAAASCAACPVAQRDECRHPLAEHLCAGPTALAGSGHVIRLTAYDGKRNKMAEGAMPLGRGGYDDQMKCVSAACSIVEYYMTQTPGDVHKAPVDNGQFVIGGGDQ